MNVVTRSTANMQLETLFATLCAQRAPDASAGLAIFQNQEELHLSCDDAGLDLSPFILT